MPSDEIDNTFQIETRLIKLLAEAKRTIEREGVYVHHSVGANQIRFSYSCGLTLKRGFELILVGHSMAFAAHVIPLVIAKLLETSASPTEVTIESHKGKPIRLVEVPIELALQAMPICEALIHPAPSMVFQIQWADSSGFFPSDSNYRNHFDQSIANLLKPRIFQ